MEECKNCLKDEYGLCDRCQKRKRKCFFKKCRNNKQEGNPYFCGFHYSLCCSNASLAFEVNPLTKKIPDKETKILIPMRRFFETTKAPEREK